MVQVKIDHNRLQTTVEALVTYLASTMQQVIQSREDARNAASAIRRSQTWRRKSRGRQDRKVAHR